MAFPNWRTTLQLEATDLMVDRVELVCRGEYVFETTPRLADVVAALTRGRTPFGTRLPRGFRWVSRRVSSIALGPVPELYDWLIDVRVTMGEPTVTQPNRMGVTATIDINPTRIRALIPGGDASQSGLTRVSPPLTATLAMPPLDNQLSDAQLLQPGAAYEWIGDAAQMLDGAVRLTETALFNQYPYSGPFRGSGRFNSVSIRQIEIYADFRSDDPVRQIIELHRGLQGGSRTGLKSVTIDDEAEYRTVTVPLINRDNTKAVFYSRGNDRIRAEVRYLRNVSRAVRGAATGNMQQRLLLLSEDAMRRLNRLLRSSWPYRSQRGVVGLSTLGELVVQIVAVIPHDRLREVIDQLGRYRHIRAGAGALAMLSDREASQLLSRRVLRRAPNRARDVGGTVFALHHRFAEMPGGIIATP